MPEPDPLWLQRLRLALFAQPGLAAEDDQFAYEGERYLCRRTLAYAGTRLLFRETWLDPLTYSEAKTWQQEVDARSFVGPLPELVFHQMIVQLAAWLPACRPRRPMRPERREFNPYQFARTKQGGSR